jgi:hypothetical protein
MMAAESGRTRLFFRPLPEKQVTFLLFAANIQGQLRANSAAHPLSVGRAGLRATVLVSRGAKE